MGIEQAVAALHKEQDFKKYIFRTMEEGIDEFHVQGRWGLGLDDDSGDGLRSLHVVLDDTHKGMLEEAMFEIILSPTDYFRRVKEGGDHPTAPAYHVGSHLVFLLTFYLDAEDIDDKAKILAPRFKSKAKEWALKIDNGIKQDRELVIKGESNDVELIGSHIEGLLVPFHYFASIALRENIQPS